MKQIINDNDFPGMRFGKLSVIEKTNLAKGGNSIWICLCDCGQKTLVAKNNIISGNTKSCGCLKHMTAHNSVDKTGLKFGKLTVLERIGRTPKDKQSTWLCQCECGNTTVTKGGHLASGITKSCGCLNHVSRRGDKSPNFRGGHKDSNGYLVIKGENRNGKWTGRPQHILVMENTLGRKLKDGETVHHKNGIRDDNRIENLELWTKKHPPGQRVDDMISFCVDYLAEYAPEYLAIPKQAVNI